MDDHVDVELARALFAERRHDVAALQALLAEARASRQSGGPGLPDLLVARGLLDRAAVDERLRALGLVSLGDAPPSAPALPVERVGDYRLVERLGAGGMGEVFRAVHEPTGADAAVKLMHRFDDAAHARFCREAAAQARVDSHPNVVRVHAAGLERGRAWLAMDFMPGGDLASRLRAGPLPPLEAARVVAALARGLAHVHRRGVLHRDLKPHNVLFDALGQPRLVDFGLALMEGEASLTATGALLGTPAYMAPEQAMGLGHQVDERADVYGLGAVLYHCLTGRPPFEGPTTITILHRVLHDPPEPPRRLVPEIPPALEAVCLRALAKDPDERWPDAAAFAAALEAPPPVEGRALARVATAAAVVLVAAAALVGARAGASARREEARREALGVAAVVSDEVGAAFVSSRELAADEALPASWRRRRDEVLRELEGARAGAPPDALARVEALAAAFEGLVAAARGDLPRARRCLDDALADPAAQGALAALDGAEPARSAGDEVAPEDELDEAMDAQPASAPSPGGPAVTPLGAWTLALRGALDALAPDGDPARGRRALEAARAAGARRPELEAWLGHAAARAALAALQRGEHAAALEHVLAAPPSDALRDELAERARASAQPHLAELAATPVNDRRGAPALRALDALLRVILVARPGRPPFEGEPARTLEEVALESVRPLVELAPHVADGAPGDLALQRRVADHGRRIAWPAFAPDRKAVLAGGYLRAIERALAATPPGAERDDLELLGCDMLLRARRHDEALLRAEALLAREDLPAPRRAHALLVRAACTARRAGWPAARPDLDEALALDPSFHRARFERARARRDAGDHPGALDDALEFLLAVDGQVELVRAMVPWATAWAWSSAWRTNQVPRVVPALEKHVEAFPSPEHVGWRVRLAFSRLIAGDADGGRATLEAALPHLRQQRRLAEVTAEVERVLEAAKGRRITWRELRPAVVALDRLRRGRTLP